MSESIRLAEQGSRFVGGHSARSDAPSTFHAGLVGRPDYDTPGRIVVDQTYVEYQIPEIASGPPVVMLAGGCHTAVAYHTTPDGQEGWRSWWVRRGFPVYLVDHPGRGRSGFDPTTHARVRRGELPPSALPNVTTLTAEALWPMFRFGPRLGEAWPGVQFPVEHLDGYMAQIVPDFDLPDLRNEVLTAAIAELLDEIGPAVLFSHSASVSAAWAVVRLRPDLVVAHIAVEGPGSPVDELGASPPDGEPSNGGDARDGELRWYAKVPSLAVFGDNIDRDTLWPVFRASCEAFAADVSSRGGLAEVLDLPALGVKGNTHLLMSDRNAAEVCERIRAWVSARLGASVPSR